MRLGLRGLPGAIGAFVAVIAVSWSPVATAVDAGDSWTVTVAPASRTLYPGTEATMSYDVRNRTAGPLRLHGTSASVHVRGNDGCLAQWFRIGSNTVPTDVDVAPGASAHGTLRIEFDAAPVSQDACKNIDLEVVVTAS